MCPEPRAARWCWVWVLVWSAPVYQALWMGCYYWVFDGEWPAGDGLGVLFSQAGSVAFWAMPAWTLGMMIALPLSGWRTGMLVAFGFAFLLEIAFWRELLAEF